MPPDPESNSDPLGTPLEYVEEREDVIDEPPPFLGAWKNVYIFALVELACVIGLFYAFTVAFRP